MPKNNPLKNNDLYDRWWTNYKSANEEDPGTLYRSSLIIKTISKLNPKNIVDAGCGAGELIDHILKHSHKSFKITGLDVSPKIIEINKNRFRNVRFNTIDLNKNQQITRNYDLVINSEVIEHIKKWEIGITNLSNLTKKGGFLILTTQSGKIFKHHKTLSHLKHFKKVELERELIRNGFRIVDSHYCGWPFMDLKNYLATIFYQSIEKNLLKAEKQSSFNKVVLQIFKVLYAISSKSKGPQIFIAAQKVR
ncbi:MAG: class I SAM-dependent methyltransferase [Patescibacteria group bacterium]|nr:class I SAM-dependent methyltransferase [Patescibacteria group bacterium]